MSEQSVADGSGVPELVIVTGMSGAGRSTVGHALEDLGWFVVDNLPPALLPTLLELGARSQGSVPRIAAVVDVRGRSFFADLRTSLGALAEMGIVPRVVYLEASDDALVRRFESVRRAHPLQAEGRVTDGIAAERTLLEEVRETADLVIDTTTLNVHELRSRVEEALAGSVAPTLRATLVSFGFKYGLPADADLVLDCRFLPNPHWVPELRPRSGLDPEVSAYVLAQPGAGGAPRPIQRRPRADRPRVPPGRQALCDGGRRLHGRQAPQRGDVRGTGGGCSGTRASRLAWSTATWVASDPTDRGGRAGWGSWPGCHAAGPPTRDARRHRSGHGR